MADAKPPKTEVIDVSPHDHTAKTKVEVDAIHKKVYVTEYHPRHKLTRGDKLSDKIAEFGGSWTFIILFLGFLGTWIVLNVWLMASGTAFDKYPFILLNLALSCLTALQAPVILMSQNRAAQRDRRKEELDHIVNKKAEYEIEDMQKDLEEIKSLIRKLQKKKSKK